LLQFQDFVDIHHAFPDAQTNNCKVDWCAAGSDAGFYPYLALRLSVTESEQPASGGWL